jgi:hypothetical protein
MIEVQYTICKRTSAAKKYKRTPCLVARLGGEDGAGDAEVGLVRDVGGGAQVRADASAFQNRGQRGEDAGS